MPLQKLQFRPGVNREGTSLSNEGGWFDCDKIRFRSGFPEKIGGWTVETYNTFLGVCRSIWNWITLKQFNLASLGTHLKFYIENGGAYYDITPIRATNTGVTFAATNGSSLITVTDASVSGLQVNDFVTFSGAVSLGGNITAAVLNQEYQIQAVLSGTSYRISARAAVTGNISTTNGGAPVLANASDVGNGGAAVSAAYQISTGFPIYTVGTGWGTGPWVPYATATLTNPFATVNGSTTITVTQASHGLTTGQYVVFASISSTSIGGIPNTTTPPNQPLLKAFQVTNTGTNTYTIISPMAATATNASQGGTVVVYYPSASVPGSTTRTWGSSFTTGFGLQMRLWSQSNFGEDLLFSPRGSALYLWQPGAGSTPAYTTRGVLISGLDVPSKINQIMVSDSTRIVIAFGCDEYGPYGSTPQDPLLIRWTAQETYTDWSPTAENQAGSYRLSHGSEIICAIQTRQEIIVFTDSAIYSMQYLGPPYVWSFVLLADNISIVSPNAVATAAGAIYWMGTDKFYAYAGRVETLPCSVRQYVFGDFNRAQEAQVYAGTNEGYSEIWWFYCSANSDTIDRYVIFNYLDRVWYYGAMNRTAWLDSPLRTYPMATTGDSLLVYHESAVDDGTTNPPSPITSYVQSSDFDIGDGHNYGFVWRMLPDITFNGSTTPSPEFPRVNFTVRPKQNPGANYGVSQDPLVTSAQSYAGQQSYNVQQFTEIVYTRIRGRQMAFRVDSNTLGTQWQLGVPMIDSRLDGRR